MTASSIGLFACRVQPIGLPTGGAATIGSSRMNVRQEQEEEDEQQRQQQQTHNNQLQMSTRPIRPTAAAVRRASRNLFGKPEPGDIDKIIRDEYDRSCAYVRERYNFDIRSSKPANPVEKLENNSATEKPLPTLIAQELEEQQSSAKRLKKCNNLKNVKNNYNNRNRINCENAERTPQSVAGAAGADITITSTISKEGLISSATPTNFNNHTSHQRKLTNNNSIQKQQQKLINNVKLCKTIGGGTGAGGDNERLKTIAKQTLITDCFNMRKSASMNVKHIKRQHDNQEVLPEMLHAMNDPVTADHEVSLTKTLSEDRTVAANVLLSLQITATTADSLHA